MSYSLEEINNFFKRSGRMWKHECPVEHTTIEVGDGEPCNWCGLYEEQYLQLKKNQIKNKNFNTEEFLQEIKQYHLPHFKEG